jgi:hypothetical protein
MDIHKNARLTLRSREALVESVNRGLCFSRAAASFRVTPKTAAKWVRRFCGTAPLVRIAVQEPLRLARPRAGGRTPPSASSRFIRLHKAPD